MPLNIAIDGPSGAGKSTAAKLLSKKLGFLYIDTGALYRAIGLYCLRSGVKNLRCGELVEPKLKEIRIELKFIDGVQRVLLNGEDVSDQIRTPAVSMAASDVSPIPNVRAFLLELQRGIARENHVIMDGRDIGTVILPHAQVKFFLSASIEARACRRTKELKERGVPAEYETVLAEMAQRDKNDSSREIAPLKAAADAVLIDNSELSLEETVARMERLIKERAGNCFTGL